MGILATLVELFLAVLGIFKNSQEQSKIKSAEVAGAAKEQNKANDDENARVTRANIALTGVQPDTAIDPYNLDK